MELVEVALVAVTFEMASAPDPAGLPCTRPEQPLLNKAIPIETADSMLTMH
jgi:hypothetical protein